MGYIEYEWGAGENRKAISFSCDASYHDEILTFIRRLKRRSKARYERHIKKIGLAEMEEFRKRKANR